MAYGQDLAGASRRHLAAAQRLYEAGATGDGVGHRAVAGYLFGLSGELALKQIMTESGMRPLDKADRREDPFYAHFPNLRTMLLNVAKGRRQGDLVRYANDGGLFQYWDNDMRYAPASDITEERTAAWRKQAEELVSDMGL